MAKVKNNLMLRGVSGTLGRDFVIRQMKDGSIIISAKPDFSNRKFSEGQLTHQSRVQQAAAYGKQASRTNPIYAELAKGTNKTAYNIAFADWMKPPVIHGIQRQGMVVQVEASDNVLVTKVLVTILDADGKTLELGEAAPVHDGMWEYTTTTEGVVKVAVWDLAGNQVLGEM